MNFSNIKSIEIPQGVVKQITTSQGVVLWKAEEPVETIPEWYGKSENYDFSQDYFNMLPLDNGTVYFELINGNENYLLYNNTGSDNDTWSTLPLTLVETTTETKKWSMPVTKLQPIYLKITSTDYKFYTSLGSSVDPQNPNKIYNMTCNFYVRGNLDKSFYITNNSQNLVFKKLFENNTHLIGAKYLVLLTNVNVMTYSTYGCGNMFAQCSNLVTVPIVEIHGPASRGLYEKMFYQCTSITESIKDFTLSYDMFQCQNMYNGCRSLNYIFMLATDISTFQCFTGWVAGVAATGIFVKNISASWTDTGNSSVPSGWTVIYYDTTEDKYYLDQQKSQECDDHGNAIVPDTPSGIEGVDYGYDPAGNLITYEEALLSEWFDNSEPTQHPILWFMQDGTPVYEIGYDDVNDCSVPITDPDDPELWWNQDTDGDGISDDQDEYPDDPYNGGSPDTDGDGIPDDEDEYPDDPYNGEEPPEE